MQTGERVVWFLIGASIGAGIALLYAPKTGKETRRYLRKRAENARDAAMETGEQIRNTLVETGENVLGAGKGVYRKGVDLASGAAEGAAGLFERGRKRVAG